MLIVDAHMHLWDRIDGRLGRDRVRPEALGAVRIGRRRARMMPPSFADCRCPAEVALAYFDDAGVDVGVVVQEYLDGPQNEYLAEVLRQYPDRFFAHALPNFFRPEGCLDEWRRLREMGFRGVKIPAAHLAAATPRIRLDDPHLMRLYEALAEAGDCVLAADLAEGATQVAELKTVATAFPELPIVLGHFGMANRPGWFSQLRLAQLPNVFIESGGLCWLFRYEEPPFEDAQEAIRIASLEVGVEKLMWGSDLPRTLLDFTYRQMLDFVREGCEFFSEEEKAQFLGGNAARVYRLSTQPRKKQGLTPITAW